MTARLTLLALAVACSTPPAVAKPTALEGRNIFRFDTFGDEAFWTDTLRMHEVIQGVSPTDPPTFTIVTLMLALSGLLAAWVPAWRATRVNPMTALRCD